MLSSSRFTAKDEVCEKVNKYMSVYVSKTKPERYYIDAEGNVVNPPWKGGGIITNIRRLVEPPTEEEARKRNTPTIKIKQDLPIDDEALKALEVLKSKGLL